MAKPQITISKKQELKGERHISTKLFQKLTKKKNQ